METVPVTLGAVPPGTMGAPPPFGNAVSVNKNAGPAIGTFLQELQNIVAESYGAVKAANKTFQSSKQNEKSHDEGEKVQNYSGFISIPVPVPVRLPTVIPAAAPTSVPQLASNIISTNGDAALAQSVKAEAKFQMPGVAVFAAAKLGIVNAENSIPLSVPVSPAPELTKSKTAQGDSQAQEQVVFQRVPQLIADEQIKMPDPGVPLSAPVPDVEPAISRATHKSFSAAVGKAAHSTKSVHFADAHAKTGNDHPSLQPEVRISEMPIANNLRAATTPALPSDKPQDKAQKIPSLGKQPNFQTDTADTGVKPEVKVFAADVTQAKLQTPPVQSIQGQDTASTTEPGKPDENAQLLKLVIKKTLQSSIDTHVAVGHLPGNIQPKKLDFQRADPELPGLHKSFVPDTKPRDTKPLINDQPLNRDIQLEVKAGHVETKPGDPLQKNNTSTNGHDDGVAAIAAPALAPAPVQTESANNSNGAINLQQQITLVPNTHVSPSTPAPAGKPEAPTAAPADSPLLPLPGEKMQAVRMVDRLGQAEMHLGMRTETFGSVQVHTVIRDSQVGLTIGSERGDLKTYLAAEIPGLESNLRQHDLHFSDVRFVASSFSPGGDQHGGTGSQPQSFQQGRSFPHSQTGFAMQSNSANEAEIVNDETIGLSVHA